MQGLRTPVALLLCAAVATLPCAQAAAQTTSVVVDVQAGVNYSTNPFLVRDGDTGSASTDLSVRPQLLYRDELNEAALVAQYRRSDYFTRYDAAEGYGAEAHGRRQISPTVNGHADLIYDSSIIGQGGFGLVGVVDPTPPPDLVTPDISLLGLRQRQQSYVAALGGDWRMSARDTLNGDVRVSRIDYGGGSGGLLTSSRTTATMLGYSRTLSERTSIGLQGSGSWTEFGRRGNSGAFYQPQATLSHQLSDRVRMSLAAGAVFISSTTPTGTTKVTGLSGSFTACQTNERASGCLRASSDAQATGLGDISRRYSASADYSYRLRENDVVRATVDYSRIRETSNLPQLSSVAYLSAIGSYERSLSRRVFAGVSGGYRQATGGGLGRPSDLNFKFFVRTRLGDLR